MRGNRHYRKTESVLLTSDSRMGSVKVGLWPDPDPDSPRLEGQGRQRHDARRLGACANLSFFPYTLTFVRGIGKYC